jgi:hypothetical protein
MAPGGSAADFQYVRCSSSLFPNCPQLESCGRPGTLDSKTTVESGHARHDCLRAIGARLLNTLLLRVFRYLPSPRSRGSPWIQPASRSWNSFWRPKRQPFCSSLRLARNFVGDLRGRNLVGLAVRFAPLPASTNWWCAIRARTHCSRTGITAIASMRASGLICCAATNSTRSTTARPGAHVARTIAELSDHRQRPVASDESAESGVPQLGDPLWGRRRLLL